MRVAICEWTTFPASVEDELAAYRAAGAGGIGILEFKTAVGPELRSKLRESGLVATHCMPEAGSILPSPLIPGPEEPEARVDSICESIGRLAELEPACVFFLTGPGGAGDRETVVEGIRRIAEAGERHGVRVALEPIHPVQAETLSFVHTIGDALELIAEADVGILFDTWHVQEVSHVDRIAGVHIADRREPTRSDFDRVLPGDGVLDLGTVVRALEAGGYDGWYDVEIFSDNGTFGDAFPDSLWDVETGELARRAVESMARL
jgi:sugar phosphate isomerase/epimerase